jgi:Cu2+-exporting ATPase
LVTGESEPQSIESGKAVEAGTLNLTGAVDMRATRAASDSFLAEVARMMAAAEQGRGNYTRIADRMAKIYSPSVHLLALSSFIGWMIWTGGDVHTSLTVAIAVLIITCPCALGLAVPVAHVVSAGRLFSAGILMKDGAALERMESVTHAVFDKTGTLTTGEPNLRATAIPLGMLSSVAKALAQRSVHPASRALAKALSGSSEVLLSELREYAGQGVEAVVEGKRARLGRAEWVAEIAAVDQVGEGHTAFALEDGPLYLSSFIEQVRPDAADVIASLAQRGIRSTILSGDARATVARLARELGVADYQAELKPGQKLAYVQHAGENGEKILMVGDGLNDAPALAAAHVSMAPATASDVGRNAADFVFTRESLGAVSLTLHAAKRTGAIVRQNFALAILYNVFAVPLAMAGQLNPLIAAIAMSTSSIIVVGNSLRLYALRAEQKSRLVSNPNPRPSSAAAGKPEAFAT